MFRVFNMGIGMVLACDPEMVSTICNIIPECMVIGEVTADQKIII